MMRDGMPHIRIGERRVLFDEVSVEEWIDSRRETTYEN
jgi:predicted DNA-binding transcriptional regulator AlpA